MVNTKALKKVDLTYTVKPVEMPTDELRWCSVKLNEVLLRKQRLEASVFDIEGKHAREVIRQCRWQKTTICGNSGLASAYHRPRFKRIWIEHSEFPIYQPSQIMELDPQPNGYLSLLTQTSIEALRVYEGQILMTCSGTIGNCTYIGKTLDKAIFSHDVIRITCKNEEDTGYLYSFLRTKIGNVLIRTNEYGSVVSHIEPEHLESIPIPNPSPIIKKRINDLVVRSYNLRDESNALLEKAEQLLRNALKLSPLNKLCPRYFDDTIDLRNYAVRLSKLAWRFDASYHVPIVEAILQKLKNEAAEIIPLGDPRISKRVILPGRFARVYVQEGQGVPFFGGKQLYELDPANKKYLSLVLHAKRIKEQLTLEENMVMISCSGTIGKVALVPKHWKGWTANQHIIRIEAVTTDIAGYLYVFLSTDYGRELITRFIYGSVVDEIDDRHIAQVPIPLLKNPTVQLEISRLALEANARRTEAYHAEQQAIHITNEDVIHATSVPRPIYR